MEGDEINVLKTFNWEIPVYIVLFEINIHNDNKNDECRTLLSSKGFTFDSIIGGNEVWINKNFKHKV